MKNSNNFKGKVVFVTGAASGIGQANAIAFALEGAGVVVADISEQGSHETTNIIKQAGGLALAIKCDVLQTEDVKNCLGQAIETFRRLDFAFNNAGVEQKQTLTAELAVEE
jgi:NAD(P)-dependent dehydrogenase (short-subunit alcohol dehydrogenase family)